MPKRSAPGPSSTPEQKAPDGAADVRTHFALTRRMRNVMPVNLTVAQKQDNGLIALMREHHELVQHFEELTLRFEKKIEKDLKDQRPKKKPVKAKKTVVELVEPLFLLPNLVWREKILRFITALDVRHVAATCREGRFRMIQLALPALIEPPFAIPNIEVTIAGVNLIFIKTRDMVCRFRSGDLQTTFKSPKVIDTHPRSAQIASFLHNGIQVSAEALGIPSVVANTRGEPPELPNEIRAAAAEVLRRLSSRFYFGEVFIHVADEGKFQIQSWKIFQPTIIDFFEQLPASTRLFTRLFFACPSLFEKMLDVVLLCDVRFFASLRCRDNQRGRCLCPAMTALIEEARELVQLLKQRRLELVAEGRLMTRAPVELQVPTACEWARDMSKSRHTIMIRTIGGKTELSVLGY